MIAPCVLLYARSLLGMCYPQWAATVPNVLSNLAFACLDPRSQLGGTA